MKLPKLNQSVILINTEFLIKMIKDGVDFYSGLYPGRSFPLINVGDIIYRIATNSRITHDTDPIIVIFLYKLDNKILPHVNYPNNLFVFSDIVNKSFFMNAGTNVFHFVSYFADPEELESFDVEFSDLFRQVAYDKNVFNISIVADNDMMNYYLERFVDELDKSLFVYRSLDPEIGIDR